LQRPFVKGQELQSYEMGVKWRHVLAWRALCSVGLNDTERKCGDRMCNGKT